MQYSLTTKNLELADEERGLIDEKMSRLEKYLTPPWQVAVVMEHDKHHRHGEVIKCRINVQMGKKVWHAERVNDSVLNAVDDAMGAIGRELQKNQDKLKKHRE